MPRPLEAHYSFTIPSIHDGITLDARIYHPDSLGGGITEDDSESPSWRKRGIVMAHPYAPMGGSYDDRVVGVVVDEFLRAGWIVGTFNFRGAHDSKGRTSWSGRPEQDDYVSFAACFMHYMHYIHPCQGQDKSSLIDDTPFAAIEPRPAQPSQESPHVILGGYSYGSLILRHLPPIPTILQPFSNPIAGSAADEIIARAHSLARESNTEWLQLAQERKRKASLKGHTAKPSLTMGGDETSPNKIRSSRDIRRSVDGRLSVDIGNRLRSLSHRRRKHEDSSTPEEHTEHEPITFPEIRYLLISPLTGPIATLAAPALAGKFWNRNQDSNDCIGKYPTLAVYGDQDIFTSAKKTREWGQRLAALPGSDIACVEVAGAGHFWVEQGVEKELRTALRNWQGNTR